MDKLGGTCIIHLYYCYATSHATNPLLMQVEDQNLCTVGQQRPIAQCRPAKQGPHSQVLPHPL